MKIINNENTFSILFFLILFIIIYFINFFFGSAIFERTVTNLFIYIILVVGLQVFMGNSGILSFAHIGFMSIGAYSINAYKNERFCTKRPLPYFRKCCF